jgi:hypothetical protein
MGRTRSSNKLRIGCPPIGVENAIKELTNDNILQEQCITSSHILCLLTFDHKQVRS